MVEVQSRIRLTVLVVALVGMATVSMVVDRRALREGARDLPSWAGPVLDIAVPVQKAVSLGAKVTKSKSPVPGMGWFAMLTDPQGNAFAMFQQDSQAK